MTYRYVELRWDDAQSESGWADRKDLVGVARCVTRGWLIRETSEEIVLAMTLQGEDGSKGFGGTWAIPRSTVRGEIRTLDVDRKSKKGTK